MIDINALLARIQGRAPPQSPFPSMVPTPGVPQGLPTPTMSNHMMPQPAGPYGAQAGLLAGGAPPGPYGGQAAQLAGLLGGGQVPPLPVMASPYAPGRFMPGFRPGIDTPHPGGGGKPPYHVRQV